MNQFNIVSENPESTVVSVYIPPKTGRATHYQSESELENAFIELLKTQAYEYPSITTEQQLIENLREQLEKLNRISFSDSEWNDLFKNKIANSNANKTITIQEDHIYNLKRDNGSVKNIYLIDKINIHNNQLQVINQYTPTGGKRANRYDVTILVNGLPLVHIELKRRGVDIKEAFNQINRYNDESFWADNGLFEYVQLFVISNGTYTKYYSNTTRYMHINEKRESNIKRGKRTSNSFEFTSWWADASNSPITDLMDFGCTFFAKHSLLSILTKYCVFTSEKLLLAMRPYQIVATERILSRIKCASNYKKYGTIEGGGYIWHTTGSGKTLTSFKTAQLVKELPYVDKVLFVVDRKDLDYQTMKEYDKFEKGAANSNTSTAILKSQLEKNDGKSKIIITTIQKLSCFIKSNKNHKAFNNHTVIIFDECHRSQFGDMHNAITKTFKKYHLFGFTGTPIFAENSSSGGRPELKTTEQVFGEKLHAYTIVNAISDKNVLPFRVAYVGTMKKAENILDKKVYAIDQEKALMAPKRLENIVDYILEHFDTQTKRNSFYDLKDRRLAGFNSIFATASIDAAKRYYETFQKKMKTLPSDKQLKIGLIYSFGVNEEAPDGVLDDENCEDTSNLDKSSRDFLEGAIQNYNAMFGTRFDTSSEKFQNFYKDISQRVKNRELDLLIVVNMFLTGFDATTLNTLWVDKNLKLHGLLQAFSRTNRILNSIKTFGNIVCFRDLEEETNKSIALFGNKEACGVVILRKYEDYYNGYEEDGKEMRGYKSMIQELLTTYFVDQPIVGEEAKKAFIKLYGSILRIKNILSSFDAFLNNEILTARDFQDYHSIYIDLYNEFRKKDSVDRENINDDIVFEMELIKQVEINIDYILMLIRKYHAGGMKDKEIKTSILKSIDSSIELRNKKDLIEDFIQSLTPKSEVDEDWKRYVEKMQKKELEQIIQDENLKPSETHEFVKNAFRDGFIQSRGTSLTEIIPPISRFTPNDIYTQKRESVLQKLTTFFNRFRGIVTGAN